MKAPRIAATAALTVAAMLAIGPVPTPLVPRASAEPCPATEVIFARGTTEPPGLGKVGNAFVGALRPKVSGSVGAYAVDYPASYDFGRAADGANDASAHVQYMMENCPNTKLVLGGYSQGAAIVDIVAAAPVPGFGFSAPLPPEAADHIAAVAVFGNPSNRFGHSLTENATYGPKTIDLCSEGDPVCSDGGNFAAHSNYTPGLTNQAATFVAGRL